MTINVIVPTYHRPADLERCLTALSAQTRLAEKIIVVARPDDTETWDVLQNWESILPLFAVKTHKPGQVQALNLGLDHADGDIMAITDDDAAPRPEWLQRIEEHLEKDPTVGGVGGRDWVHQQGGIENGARKTVGIVSWYGRVIGNHHLGVGEPRYVDVLKGANMSYRALAIKGIRFNDTLKGSGAQVHNDLCFSLDVRGKGWKLVYDPLVAVDHYPAERFDDDQRNVINMQALSNAAHNETVALFRYLTPIQRAIYMIWAFMVGTRVSPGILQLLRPSKKHTATFSAFRAARTGRLSGRKQG
ncbi:MAG: glycosyltransferase family A protein [Acidithiobacillus sp.]